MLKEFGFPVLTANQAEEQPYRMVRLNQVLGYVRGIGDSALLEGGRGVKWNFQFLLTTLTV